MRVGPSGKQFTDDWKEIPDDTAIEIPVKFRGPKSMEDMVALYVANAFKLQQRMRGEEDDLDTREDLEVEDGEDGEDILTPYELHAIAAEVEADRRKREWFAKQVKVNPRPPAKQAEGLDTSGSRKEDMGSGAAEVKGEGVAAGERKVVPPGVS